MGVGKLGSMYGELTSISNMGSDQDLNPGPCVHQARTLTTAPSYYPTTIIPHIIVAGPLGEGDFINEASVAAIIHNIFPFRLPIATVCRVYTLS